MARLVFEVPSCSFHMLGTSFLSTIHGIFNSNKQVVANNATTQIATDNIQLQLMLKARENIKEDGKYHFPDIGKMVYQQF